MSPCPRRVVGAASRILTIAILSRALEPLFQAVLDTSPNQTTEIREKWAQIMSASPPSIANGTSLYFAHNTKTGGTSLMRVLDALCHERLPVCWQRPGTRQTFAGQPCPSAHRLLVFSHRPFPMDVPTNGHAYSITWVREPASRVVSLASFQAVVSASMFEDGEWWRAYVGNLQTAHLAGTTEAMPGRTHCLSWLSIALHRLANEFVFVGITEHYRRSMWMLQHIMGWGEQIVLPAILEPARAFRRPPQSLLPPKLAQDASRLGLNLSHLQPQNPPPPFSLHHLRPETVSMLQVQETCDTDLHRFALLLLQLNLAALDDNEALALAAFLDRTQSADST